MNILLSILFLFMTSLATADTGVGSPASVSHPQPNGIPQGAKFTADTILVKFKPGVPGRAKANVRAALNGHLTRAYSIVPGLEKILIPSGSVEQAIAGLSQNPNIVYAEPDYEVQLQDTRPDDADYSVLWGMERIKAPGAWDSSTGNPNTLIAVMDTGIAHNHADLNDNMWVNPGEIANDGIDNDGNGYVDDVHGYDFVSNDSNPFDDHGHGSHVSGTICGEGNNGVGVAGVTWQCRLIGLKFLGRNGSGSYSGAIAAIEYAVQMGARFSNHSWSGTSYSSALRDAISNAAQAGHIVIAAAGNSGNNIDNNPEYPAAYTLNNIISVANIEEGDGLRYDSNYGASSVDLGAPGSSIYSTTPGNNYAYFWGTSMAAPHVTGTLALMAAQNPLATAMQLKQTLLASVEPLAALSGKSVTGGILDAAAAVNASNTSEPPPSAGFSSAVAGLTVSFTDTSTDSDGSIVSWYWDFGDGNTSSIQSPSHNYASAGSYTVTLTVTDNDGGTDSVSKSVTATDPNASPNLMSNPGFESNFTNWIDWGSSAITTTANNVHTGSKALQVGSGSGGRAQNISSMVAGNQYTLCAWSKLETSSTQAWVGVHLLDSSDVQIGEINYPVTWTSYEEHSLTFTYPANAASANIWLWVGGGADRAFADDFKLVAGTSCSGTSGGNNPPVAGFSWSTADLTADFTDTSTDSDGNVVSWLWDFGDDNQSTSQHPSHNYAVTGSYNVTLTVTDDEGATDSSSQSVSVAAPNVAPSAGFTVSNTDLTANFTDTSIDSDGTVVSWSWIFGDGNYSTTKHPSHTYASADSYTVTLIVTDNDGATDTRSQSVSVTAANAAPSAGFTVNTTDLTANFTDTSTDSDGTVDSWLWNFGDGNSSTSEHPSHTYDAAGSYTVTLTVTDNNRATDSSNQSVSVVADVNQPPAAPSDLTATVESSGKGKKRVITGVILNWVDNASNETGFSIEACVLSGKGRNKSCEFGNVGSVGENVESFGAADLVNYDRFRVKAVNDHVSSAFSNEVRL